MIPNVKVVQIELEKDVSKFPPTNTNYKPNPIDVATVLKCKDEDNGKVSIYWSTPANSFGETISYRILPSTGDEEKKDEPTIIEDLPYTFPLSSIPTSFRVVTIANIEDVNYESAPSEIIVIGEMKPSKMPTVTPKKKEPEPPRSLS